MSASGSFFLVFLASQGVLFLKRWALPVPEDRCLSSAQAGSAGGPAGPGACKSFLSPGFPSMSLLFPRAAPPLATGLPCRMRVVAPRSAFQMFGLHSPTKLHADRALTLDFMLCSRRRKILSIFEQGSPRFHFAWALQTPSPA